jgi:NAD(P)-dependent dehydrogenase (short-subunit alcohol dehydrogenase family)
MKFTNDGMEECFATNFLGHYYLSQLLQPSLQDNGAIVVTASGAHNQADRVGKHLGYRGAKYSTAAQVALGELTQKTSVIQSARDRYATSKFCVLLYTFSEPRWRNAITVSLIAIAPGTGPRNQIGRDLGPIAKIAWQSIFPVVGRMFAGFSTIESSGAALAKLMSEPDLAPQTGLHVDYRLKTATEAEETHDRDLQNDLVTFCETACQ